MWGIIYAACAVAFIGIAIYIASRPLPRAAYRGRIYMAFGWINVFVSVCHSAAAIYEVATGTVSQSTVLRLLSAPLIGVGGWLLIVAGRKARGESPFGLGPNPYER